MIGTARKIGAATSAKIWQTDRGAWTVLVAVLFLTVGFLFPWELVPSTERSYLYADRLELKFNESVLALPLRIAVVVLVCLLLFEVVMGERQRILGRAGAWIILALTLAFPYAVNLWEPEIAYDGATVWNSLDEMIWTEIDRSYGYMQTDWRNDEPLQHPDDAELALLERPLAGLFPVPSGAGGGFGPDITIGRVGSPLAGGLDLTFFRSARLPEVFSTIFGFSNAFLNLASKGWYFTLMGSLIAIIGLYLPGGPNTVATLRRDLKAVVVCYALFGAALLAPRLIAESDVLGWENALARGDRVLAEKNLQDAARWRPILNYDIEYYAKLGELARDRNCAACPESILNLAFEALNGSQYREAIDLMERFERRYPERSKYIKYFMGLAYQEWGIDLYEGGQESAAAETWKRGLQLLPTSSWYYWELALTQFHTFQFEQAARSMEHIRQLQQTIFWKRLPASSQWYVAKSWEALKRKDIPLAHAYYSLSVTPENW